MNANTIDRESEISLLDIFNFLAVSWKKLAIATLIGATMGFLGWALLSDYSAEYILLNNASSNTNNNTNSNTNNNTNSNTNNNTNSNTNNNTNSNTNINTSSNTSTSANINTYALDLVSWKIIQKNLPNLAAQVLAENNFPIDQLSLYRDLSDERWWQKNITPSYAISKADTKELAGISRDLDAASTTILSLNVRAVGRSKQSSIDNVRAAAKFLRTGGAYLQLRNLLNGYEAETISTVADIQKKITTTEIEMGYQIQRAKALEDLHKRFPGNAGMNSQVFELKESSAKYLPISTQIIAVNSEINQSKEMLERLRDRLLQIAIIKNFLDEAVPLAEKTFDGLALNDQLLNIELKLRSKLLKDDVKGQEILDQLHAQLLQVQARFTKGLEANTAPTSKKTGAMKLVIGGLMIAFILMLVVLLGQRAWKNVKSGGIK